MPNRASCLKFLTNDCPGNSGSNGSTRELLATQRGSLSPLGIAQIVTNKGIRECPGTNFYPSPVAQWLERRSHKRRDLGSNPTRGDNDVGMWGALAGPC